MLIPSVTEFRVTDSRNRSWFSRRGRNPRYIPEAGLARSGSRPDRIIRVNEHGPYKLGYITSTDTTGCVVWFVLGGIAVWILVGAGAAVWIGRAISHATLEEEAAELRRKKPHDALRRRGPKPTRVTAPEYRSMPSCAQGSRRTADLPSENRLAPGVHAAEIRSGDRP